MADDILLREGILEEDEEEDNYEEEGEEEEAEEDTPKTDSDGDISSEDSFKEDDEGNDDDAQTAAFQKEIQRPLTSEQIRESLQMLSRIGNGLSHAYIKLDCRSKQLTDINLITRYIHLRYVDFSGNSIRDLSPLASLQNLVVARMEENQLTSMSLEELPYLQKLYLHTNKIEAIEGVNHPLLSRLNLAHNVIQRVSGLNPERLDHLHTLDLRENKLVSTAGIYPPGLKELYLPGNLIASIADLEGLCKLEVLHLRDNQIETLDGFTEHMKALQYINLRGNNISEFQEVEKLRCLPALRALILMENPLNEDEQYRLEVLLALNLSNNPGQFERLDKEFFLMEDFEEADELLKQRMNEEAEDEEDEVGSEARRSRETTKESTFTSK